MTLGFIGTGHITAALVEGLCTTPAPPERIIVSPRNTETAAGLAARFPAVEVAADNQAVVDGADTVFLAVLPKILADVVGPLRFRPAQLVLSLVGVTPRATIIDLVAPAGTVVRAVPLPSAARHLGPIAFYPKEPRAEAILSTVGLPVAAADESSFHRLWSLTALVSPYCALLEALCRWTVDGGIDPRVAGVYVSSLTAAIAAMASEVEDGRFERLAKTAATPGGINEQALGIIRERDGLAVFRAALDAVFERMEAPRLSR